MQNAYEKAEAARHYIQQRISTISLNACIIAGTGLGEVWKDFEIKEEISYQDIPHFPKNTVQSHAGILYCCQYKGVNIAVLSGRFHFYEGHDAHDIAFPIRVMHLLGIQKTLITNVAGGLAESFKAGTIVAVKDHINLQPDHVLRGVNDHRFGNRFPDMLMTYDQELIKKLLSYSIKEKLDLQQGVYLALQGPSLETPAEYRFLKSIGADLVGMSTVPEVIAAKHIGMRITCMSVVSNVCYPFELLGETTVEEVIAVANKTIPDLNKLIKHWLTLD